MSEVASVKFRERDRRASSGQDSDNSEAYQNGSLQVSGQGQIRRDNARIAGSIKNFKPQVPVRFHTNESQ